MVGPRLEQHHLLRRIFAEPTGDEAGLRRWKVTALLALVFVLPPLFFIREPRPPAEDLAALAAFIWAFFVTYQIWRKRRDNQG